MPSFYSALFGPEITKMCFHRSVTSILTGIFTHKFQVSWSRRLFLEFFFFLTIPMLPPGGHRAHMPNKKFRLGWEYVSPNRGQWWVSPSVDPYGGLRLWWIGDIMCMAWKEFTLSPYFQRQAEQVSEERRLEQKGSLMCIHAHQNPTFKNTVCLLIGIKFYWNTKIKIFVSI